MKVVKLFLAGVISLVVNMQALSLPTALTQTAPHVGNVHTASTNQFSRNWSGYSATGGTFTGTTGTWHIPKSTARNFGIDATWVGVGGVNTDDLIQAGTQTIVDTNGQARYEAFYEILPSPSQPVNLVVHGGDSISASVMKQKEDVWIISLIDNTTGDKTQFNIHYPSSQSSADWIEEAPSGERNILPLDNFGTVNFTGATAIENGQKVTLSEANAQAMHMGEGIGNVLAVTSVIGSNGQSFSVQRTTASSEEPEASLRQHMGGN